MTSSSTYSDLISALEAAHKRTARFHTAAFHVHSIDSYDWGKREHADGDTNHRGKFVGEGGPDRYLDALVGAGIQLAGITDHMRSSYACELAAAAAERDDITVFPGMEVNCRIKPFNSHRIHLLVLFPPDARPDQIDRIFASQHAFPSEKDRDGRSVEAEFDDLSAFAGQVRRAGGMIVIAHIDDRQRGCRSLFRAEREQSLALLLAETADERSRINREQIPTEFRAYMQAVAPDAIELQRVGDQKYYGPSVLLGEALAATPCVMRTDHHCVEDFSRRDRLTHVKASELTFEGVRRALQFHPTRIRFSDDVPDSLSPRIVGVRLRSPSGVGLFRDATIAFNRNLNCLIGPRGSGKSTVLEALRFVLGQNDQLEQIDFDTDAVSPADLARSIQRANLRSTSIEVVFEMSPGEIRVLDASYEEDQYTTRVFLPDGTEQEMGRQAVAASFPVRIYSWGEIETLGRRPARQRDLVDRLIPEIQELREEAAGLRLKLAQNRSEVVRRARLLDERLAEGAALPKFVELKESYERLNTDEAASLFARLDLARAKLKVLSEIEGAIGRTQAKIAALEREPVLDDANEVVAEAESKELDSWARELSSELGIKVFRESLAASSAEYMEQAEAVLATTRERHDREKELHAAIETELRESTQTDAEQTIRRDQREAARRRFEVAADERNAYLKDYRAVLDLLEQREMLVERLEEVRAQVSAARSSSTGDLSEQLLAGAAGMNVTVEVAVDGDRGGYVAHVEEHLLHRSFAGRYKDQKIAARLGEVASPSQLAAALLNGDPTEISDALAEADDKALDINRIVDALSVALRNVGADVEGFDPVRLERALKLHEVPVDDGVKILLDGRPVDELSPGQRAGAMLPLVALSETSPLIIDQPEDNLDNRLVGDTLTNILSKLKERRQIIIATHNPNIVVGGDAEQVVVLGSKADHEAQVESAASIDDDEVIRNVLAIMEGGRDAFDERARRYGGAARSPHAAGVAVADFR